MTTTADNQAYNPRGWPQFRLRTLLIVTALCVIPFALLGGKVRDTLRERAVIRWVRANGGQVAWEAGWRGALPGGRVTVVFIPRTNVSDLSPLAGLKILQRLDLELTQVTDLSPLARHKNLEELVLNRTQVSDLSPLADLKNLETLWLEGTPVSDLTPLTGLENLERLHLEGTPVSKEQVEMLQKALPNCDIEILFPYEADEAPDETSQE